MFLKTPKPAMLECQPIQIVLILKPRKRKLNRNLQMGCSPRCPRSRTWSLSWMISLLGKTVPESRSALAYQYPWKPKHKKNTLVCFNLGPWQPHSMKSKIYFQILDHENLITGMPILELHSQPVPLEKYDLFPCSSMCPGVWMPWNPSWTPPRLPTMRLSLPGHPLGKAKGPKRISAINVYLAGISPINVVFHI